MQAPTETDGLPDMSMDPKALYREEVYTDRKVGTLRVMAPITAEGHEDPERPTLYLGQAQIVTPGGALPITFDIEASTLSEAVSKFAEGAQHALEDTIKEIEQMRRDEASSILIPGAGNMGGGGGIQMP